MFRSIRNQLTLIICSLIILTLSSALMLSYYLVARDYEEKIQQTNSALAESLGSNIAQFMQNYYNISQIMAAYPDLTTFDAEKQRQLLVDVTNHYSSFQLLAIHNLNGDQTARSSGSLANRAERWWFKKFMEEKTSFITKTYYSLATNSPVTTIINGIYSSGDLVGVLMSDIEIYKLQQMVDNYNSGTGNYVYLLDGEGVVIAHPDREQVTGLNNYKTMKKSVLVRDVNGRTVKDEKNNEITEELDFPVSSSLQQIVYKVVAGENGVGEYTDLNGEKNLCAYRTILLPGKSQHWSLIVVQRKNAALAFLDGVIIKNILVGFCVLVLSTLLTLRFARRLTNPLLDIVNATNRIKDGDLTVRLAIKSSNEINMLAMNFNQMVSELQLHREGLEQLVEARTAELEAANQELTVMNEEMLVTNQLMADENNIRRQVEENLVLRELQYRAITSLLTHPVEEIEGLLESVLRSALQLVKAPDGCIVLYDDNGENFFARHVIGIYEQFIMQNHSLDKGMIRHVYNTGEVFWVEDYQQYPDRVNDKRLDKVTTAIMLPLKEEGQVKGILCASWRDVIHLVSNEDIEVLRQFCDLASVALERTNTQKKIHQIAFYDSLTGLPNRASLNLHLEEEMQKVQSGKASGIILFIDIDDLKTFNDNYGHNFGDSVIVSASLYIVEAVGEKAFVCHSGGDEFIVVLPGEHSREKAAEIADNVLGALCQEYQVSEEYFHLSASIGVAIYPDDGDNAEDILKKVDIAMYAAKRSGRSCWRFYEPIFLEEAYQKMILTNGLRRALEREEFFLQYQPQLTAKGDAVVGFEALVRWKSSEHGFVSPAQFIPLAEQSGLILLIGQWVLQEACQFARRLADLGKGHIHVAVNISPRQLATDNFVDIVSMSIEDAGIKPEQLELEITESVLIESLDDSISKLNQLREMGVMLSLDDFGTGYSSLTYLRSLPVGVLKIDKSFIDKIHLDNNQIQVVGTIVNLGHNLGLTIVAEGVESEEQLTLLRQCSCDYIQGYIYSRPILEEEAIRFLDD